MPRTRTLSRFSLLLAVSLGLSGCRSDDVIHITLDQGPPTFHNPEAQGNVTGYEAISSFQAPLLSGGRMVGELVGMRQVVEKTADFKDWGAALKPDGFDARSADQLLMIYTMTFNLGGEDALLVQGPGIVESGQQVQMRANTPEVRSIVGGTGKYRYARGQVISTRGADGSYRHVLDFKN